MTWRHTTSYFESTIPTVIDSEKLKTDSARHLSLHRQHASLDDDAW